MQKIKAAGAIVYRHSSTSVVKNLIKNEAGFAKLLDVTEILLVHRPKYQDWSFPKGKLDPGETSEIAAVREVAEETGTHIALDLPIGNIEYHTEGTKNLKVATRKSVQYYIAHEIQLTNIALLARDPVKPASKKEIDDVRWVSIDEAKSLLTYRDDLKMLDKFLVELKHLKLNLSDIPLSTTELPLLIEYKRKKFGKMSKSESKRVQNDVTGLFSSLGIDYIVIIDKDNAPKKLADRQKTVKKYVKLTGCETIVTPSFSQVNADKSRRIVIVK